MSTDYNYTNLKKECKEKISSLLSLKSRPESPCVSPWSVTSETSVFTFAGSDVSPAGLSPRHSPRLSPRLSPLVQRRVTRAGRPISPLVTSAYNKYNRNLDKVGKVDPKLYRSISLDSYDFTTLSEDFMGKIYFQVRSILSDVWFIPPTIIT